MEARIIQLIKKQVEIENDLVKRISELEKRVHTAAARLLLTEMCLDSQKHASLLNGILQVLGNDPQKKLWSYEIESYADKLAVKKELEKHVKMEDEVLSQVQEEIKQTNDEALKLLLQHIAEDEEKHHKILEIIVKNSYKINP